MEIEAQFQLHAGETASTLASAERLGPYQLGDAETLHVTDQYLDTEAHDCFHQGYTCRLRSSERGAVVTLKSLSRAAGKELRGVARRDEIEQPLPRLTFDVAEWPQGPAQVLAGTLCHGRPLMPLLILLQERTERGVFAGDRKVGLLTIDHVWPQIAGHEDSDYRIVELELGSEGTDADLPAAVDALAALPGMQPSEISKFERALALMGKVPEVPSPHRSDTLTSDQSMASAGATIMARYWKDVMRREAAVRRGDDAEAVHDMRVAVRRLRAGFALFAPWYARKHVRGFKSDLRRLGRVLGAVRDLEVLVEEVRSAAPKLADAELNGLLAGWEESHAASRVRLLSHLDSDRFHRFAHRFEDFLSDERDTTPAPAGENADANTVRPPAIGPNRICDVVPAEVWKRYGAVRAYAPFVGDASLEQLHRLRIAGKHLRYLLEPFKELLGEPAEQVVELL